MLCITLRIRIGETELAAAAAAFLTGGAGDGARPAALAADAAIGDAGELPTDTVCVRLGDRAKRECVRKYRVATSGSTCSAPPLLAAAICAGGSTAVVSDESILARHLILLRTMKCKVAGYCYWQHRAFRD